MNFKILKLQPILILLLILVTTMPAFCLESNTLQNQKVPDFTLNSHDGTKVKLSSYFGKKVIFLNFWASWCGPCKLEMPEFNEANAELIKSNKAILFAIDTFEKESVGKAFITKNNYSMNFLFDPDGQVAKLYNVEGIPTTIVIGLDGTVKDIQVGSTTKDFLLNHSVLKESVVDGSVSKESVVNVNKDLVFQIGSSTLVNNGIKSQLDSVPIILDGRTLIPVRAFIESVGGTVSWNANEGRADLTFNNKQIQLWANSKRALIGGFPFELDVPVKIINNRTLIPLRFVMENFGFNVIWDANSKTITVKM